MARVEGRYSDYIIIETRRPFYAVIDMFKDPEMQKLKDHEQAGTLPEQKNPTVQPKAGLYQKPSMLIEYYVDEEDGEKKHRFKDCVVLAEADERGRLFIDKSERDLARRILKTLKRIDKDVSVDIASAVSEEELLGPPPTVNKGGRPRKDRYMR